MEIFNYYKKVSFYPFERQEKPINMDKIQI